MGDPILCKLGFHKWQNYGNQVVVSWQEPTLSQARWRALEKHSKAVYPERKCERCGIRLRRKLVTNPDGTLSSVGWEPDTVETNEK